MTALDVECIQQATASVESVDIDSTDFFTQTDSWWLLSHVHGEAQTPLVRFVVDVFYKQIRSEYTTNRTTEPVEFEP